jgi:hypothetical protein
MKRSSRISIVRFLLTWMLLNGLAWGTVTVSPKHAAIVVSTQTQQFTSSDANVTWSVDDVAGGSALVGTITATGIYTPPAVAGVHVVKATTVAVPHVSGTAIVAVTDLAGVFTYHNDQARTGLNSREFALTPATVTTATFGKLFSCPVHGAIYTQPLWVPGVTIGGGTHNVIFVATQHDIAYAFDADARPCVQYWHVNLLDRPHGGTANETPVGWSDVGNCFGDIYPEVGVTGTPVIDRSTNTIYMVSASEANPMNPGSCAGTHATFFHRLHALDLATGHEKLNAPVTITASVPGVGDGSIGGIVSFASQFEHQRSGLALAGPLVVVDFAAHEDASPYHGWVLCYNAANVQQQVAVFNTTPNGGLGGIWSGGGAPAVDAVGNIYVTTGNGTFDEVQPAPNNDYGDSILRLRPFNGITGNGWNLAVAGWFTPYDQLALQFYDWDLGSGAAVLLPNQSSGNGPKHLLTEVGKEGVIYLIDRDNMGGYNPVDLDQIWQFVAGVLQPGLGQWGTPAFWQNHLYVGGSLDFLKQFTFFPSTEKFDTSVSSYSTFQFGYPGPTPSVSSRGASNGIVWALDTALYGFAANAPANCYQDPPPAACSGPAILHAYTATSLAAELWNSSLADNNRDAAGNAVKFVAPTIANGKVYVSTRREVDVYGLLP